MIKTYQEAIFTILSIFILVTIFYLVYRKRVTDSVNINGYAYRDALTGLYNRHYLANFIESFDASHTEDTRFSVVYIDLDYFKTINENYGCTVGDSFLKEIALIFKNLTRENDKVFRYSEEEFLIVFRGISKDKVFQKIEFIREFIQKSKFECLKNEITISAGISSAKKGAEINTVIEEADKALSNAKKYGRNCVKVFS